MLSAPACAWVKRIAIHSNESARPTKLSATQKTRSAKRTKKNLQFARMNVGRVCVSMSLLCAF